MFKRIKTGVALAAFIAGAGFSLSAQGGDLYAPKYSTERIGSSESKGNCYLRGDSGYSFSSDPSVDYNGSVTNTDLDGSHFLELGIGCGFARKFRGELVVGYHAEKDLSGNLPASPTNTLHSDVTSYTAMVNVYYDIGRWGRFTPYLGAGVGFAYNTIGDTFDTTNPQTIQFGNEEMSLAWSVTAGFGYKLTSRTTLDLAYRYIDLGSVKSMRHDSANVVNPYVNVQDLSAHEIKAGLRYSFGSVY